MNARNLIFYVFAPFFGWFVLSSSALADDSSAIGNGIHEPARSQALSNALHDGLYDIERSALLQNCMAEMVRNGGGESFCKYIDNPGAELRVISNQLRATGNRIFQLTPTGAVDVAPYGILGALEAEEDKIDDFAGIVDQETDGIERCSGGPASPACTVIRSTCFGDWKCYGDNTCACYTCNKGGEPSGCGIE